jgi:hypothetical protein
MGRACDGHHLLLHVGVCGTCPSKNNPTVLGFWVIARDPVEAAWEFT